MKDCDQKPVYYDGSGFLSAPDFDSASKNVVIRPDPVELKPLPYPVFPYDINLHP